MRIKYHLTYYLAKSYSFMLLMVLGFLSFIVFIFDLMESFKKSFGKLVPFEIVVEMSFLKLPTLMLEILPFAVMLATIILAVKLSLSSEIAVFRTSGLSLFEAYLPISIVTFIVGIILVLVFNPISASMLKVYDNLENKYWSNKSNLLTISSSGIWLKEKIMENQTRILHATSMQNDNGKLHNITIINLNSGDEFISRIDASLGYLEEGKWHLAEVSITKPNSLSERYENYELTTKIRKEQLLENYSDPQTVSIYELRGFIRNLKSAGFSAKNHYLHFYDLILLPFFLSSLALVALPFSLVRARKGQLVSLITASVFLGFSIYFISDLIRALGISGKLPIFFASFAPIGISYALGAILLLQAENS